MSRPEFQELMELSRKSTKEKPKSELIILSLIFFNGARIGINEIKAKVQEEYSDGWFSVDFNEVGKIIPKLVSKNLLQIEGSNYVIPSNILSVLKDIIEENLFPERDEVIRIFGNLQQPLRDKMKEIISRLIEGKFYRYINEEIQILKELEKYGLLIFARAYFISGEKTNFGDSCVFIHPTTTFTIRSELFKNEAIQLAEIHQDELLLLRKEKRELMEKVLVQQDRINSLYEENIKLHQRVRDLEEFQRGSKSGLFLKNMIIFRIDTFLKNSSLDELLTEWGNATTHSELVRLFSRIMYLLGLDSYIIDKRETAEPDILGISYYSIPPFLVLVEIKTVMGGKKLGTDKTSQVISKIERYKKRYTGFKVIPIIVTNVDINRISNEAVRDCANTATILTKNFISNLLVSHFEYKHTPSLLYTLLEPKDNPIPSIEDIRFMNALSEQENLRIEKEVILND